VYLSQVFRWYAGDFGSSTEERLRFAAGFLYRGEDRRFVEGNAADLRITYLPYDWRLNRS
jgi:hypothetical protein